MLNYIGFHVFGMFGVSWGVCILSSTSCICFSKRSRRTYSCIVDHGVAFQMPFLTKRASVQFSVGDASVGLVEQTWTLAHKVKNIKPIRNFRVYCILFSLHRFTKEVMSERSAFDTSNVRFSLTKPLRIPFLKEDLTDLVKDLPRANMGKRKSLFIYYTPFISLWHLPSWSPTMWQHLTHVLCHLQQLQSWSPKTSFLCACDARAFAVFQENIMGKWELKSQLRSN